MPAAKPRPPFIGEILGEVSQTPDVRQTLIAELEDMLGGRTVVCFFTSFVFPVMIVPQDADILEGVLHKTPLRKGLTLVIDSPGGDALAAEAIINVCRSYSHGDFEVIVPKRAKSAATMVCLGANKIWMGETSELGPVDPQVIVHTKEGWSLEPAQELVEGYKALVRQATGAKGRVEPYLQQLAKYDARSVRRYEREHDLAKSIAVNALQTGMMKKETKAAIEKRIKLFVDPKLTLAHGRRIGVEMAQKAGLCVERMEIEGDLWNKVLELHTRASYVVSKSFCKIVESREYAFSVAPPPESAAGATP